ncbi:MAG: tetratricopeptide repeat protein, partial [Thermofilum sp.]
MGDLAAKPSLVAHHHVRPIPAHSLGKLDDALKTLDGIEPAYAALVAELRGDIRLAQGDRAAAYAAYQDAVSRQTPESIAAKAGLQRKLDDLADVAPAAPVVNP